MRLLAFSDWRVQDIADPLDFIRGLDPPVDFVLYGGDDVNRFQDGGVNYLAELSRFTTQRKVLAVIGNDDTPDVRKVLQAQGVHDLHKIPYVFRNYGFIGLEASTSGPAIVSHTEKEVAKHLERQYRVLGKKTLIVLSHTPPFGILDLGIRFAKPEEHTHHIGSTSLRKFIELTQPAVVICGHCHSQGRQSVRMGQTLIVNASSHDLKGVRGNFAVLDIADHAEVQWHDTFELSDPSSLTNLESIGKFRQSKLRSGGITTIQELAGIRDLRSVSVRSGLSMDFLRKLQLKALSVVNNAVYEIRRFVPPSNDVIFFDIETDIACKRVWLIGALRNGKFTRFYADHWDGEKTALKSFLRYLSKNSNATLVSYSCTSFDRNVLRRALRRNSLDHLQFSSFEHLDLGQEIRRHFTFPTSGYGLKEIGLAMSYPFKHPDLDGFQVALAYHEHVRSKKPIDPRVIEYNEDDVRVLPFLIQQLMSPSVSIVDRNLGADVREVHACSPLKARTRRG